MILVVAVLTSTNHASIVAWDEHVYSGLWLCNRMVYLAAPGPPVGARTDTAKAAADA